MRLRRPTLALAMFDEALRLRPSFTAAHYHRAKSLAALERHAEAIASCRAALLVRPQFREVLWLLDSLLRLRAPATRATQT
jgi:tetratricopeptide (TPR) repeat protein